MKKWIFTLAIGVCVQQAFAINGIQFEHNDWELACDNTGTCRAAGYQNEEEMTRLISLLLTRPAGDAGMKMQLQVDLGSDKRLPNTLSGGLYSNAQLLVPITLKKQAATIPNEAIPKIVDALKKGNIQFIADNKMKWTLSSAGSNAVFLKMDEFQQRLNKPSALIRKGQDTSPVLAAAPIPQIKAASVLQEKPKVIKQKSAEYAKILPKKFKAQAQNNEDDACTINNDIMVYPLNNDTALLKTACWMGSYNTGEAYWLMDNSLKNTKKLLTTKSGEYINDSPFNSYENGRLIAEHKGRGIGDCWSTQEMVWNGKDFVLSSVSSSGMCRGFAGGAWKLPTYVTHVNK